MKKILITLLLVIGLGILDGCVMWVHRCPAPYHHCWHHWHR